MNSSWRGIVTYGRKVYLENENHWKTSSGIYYRDGYSCKRFYIINEREIDVTCKIFSSNLGRPLFECTFTGEHNGFEKVVGYNPTTVYRKFVTRSNLQISGKLVGQRFFGLNTKDYENVMNNESEFDITENLDVDATDISISHSRQFSFKAVLSYGTPVYSPKYEVKISSKKCRLQPGYEAIRQVKLNANRHLDLHLKIESSCEGPIFRIYTVAEPRLSFVGTEISGILKRTFEHLNITASHRWSGFEFFGLTRSDVMEVISCKPNKIYCDTSYAADLPERQDKIRRIKEDGALRDMTNIRIRNAGPTSTLCNKAVKARNEKIHKLVEYASFGDISSYVSYVCDHYFDTIVESAIQSLSENNLKKFIKTLKVVKKPVTLESKETARIMMGKYDMSQRAFKELRATLKSCNVTLPSYDDLREYCKNLEVGNIFPLHGSNESECQCMGYGCTVKDTLERVFGCNEYQHKLSFIEADRNKKLGDFLKSKNTHLYQNFKNERRTIILRDTGDNFRGAGRYPTEQTSFSIMNIQDLVSGPYGQFITTLWRGSESRETLEMHCKHHYQELSELVKNGVRLTLNGEVPEEFNVVVFLVADLAFVKEVLGKCSCTQAYGCFHCKLNINQWSSCKAKIGESRTMNEMNVMGSAARSKLGDGPNKDSAAYKNLIANNYGQWAPVLFEGVVIELIPPCGLHLILAHHRYLWKFMHDIISKRNQESLIPVALRKIGCTYIAFQIESYFKSKKKHYDGSEKLKMIGNDCKLLESNIDTFLNEFVEDKGDDWNSPRSRKLLQVLRLYKRFADLAVDIRSLNGNEERIATFEKRAEEYFQKFLLNAGSAFVSKLPYMHYLRQHIGSLMQTYYDLLGWGYGMFSTNSGEHLNKRIKYYELNETNLDKSRFYNIIKLMRTKQLHFASCVLEPKRNVICSACNEPGHTKKNRSCPFHPSHPKLEYDPSDNEEETSDEI